MTRTAAVSTAFLLAFFSAAPFANEVRAQASNARLPQDGSLRLLDAIARRSGPSGLLGRTKIVGGQPARAGDDPWQVALLDAGNQDTRAAQFCGGSIIGPGVVVTAAHCVDRGTRADQVHVLSGTVDLRSGGVRSRVLSIRRHPAYDSTTLDSDIAILLIEAGHAGAAIAVIQPSQEPALLTPRAPTRTTGWGDVREDGPASAVLREIRIPHRTRDECREARSHGDAITDNMICAGDDRMEQDACQGDSGGPMTVRLAGQPVLAGVVSWGDGCANRYKFGIFTRVSRFADWIAQHASMR